MTAECLSATANVVMAIATAAAVLVAWKQLRNLDNTLRVNGLLAILQLEADMNGRKQRVDDAGERIRLAKEAGTHDPVYLGILGQSLRTARENWLNAAERLAFCIRKEYLPERDWRAEYRPYFAELVRGHADAFGPGTIYTNIVDLNDKWQRE